MHIFDELKERGLVFQTTDEEALRKIGRASCRERVLRLV